MVKDALEGLDVEVAFKALERSFRSALSLNRAVLKSVTTSTEKWILSEFLKNCVPGNGDQLRFRPVEFQKYSEELSLAVRDSLAAFKLFRTHKSNCEIGNARHGVICEYKYATYLESFWWIVGGYVTEVDTGVCPHEEEFDLDTAIEILPKLKQELRRAEDYIRVQSTSKTDQANRIETARADNGEIVENKYPENPDVVELCKAICENKGSGRSINELAREITNGDEKLAGNLTRAARRKEFKWLREGGL